MECHDARPSYDPFVIWQVTVLTPLSRLAALDPLNEAVNARSFRMWLRV